MALCKEKQSYHKMDDPRDVLVLSCDREDGHGGPHRDPTKNTEWRKTNKA